MIVCKVEDTEEHVVTESWGSLFQLQQASGPSSASLEPVGKQQRKTEVLL